MSLDFNSKIGIPDYLGPKTAAGVIPAEETTFLAADGHTKTTFTGTITHASTTPDAYGKGIVTGTGTLFIDQLEELHYIFANGEVRKIERIESNTRLIVSTPFGATFATIAIKISRPCIYRYVKIENAHASAAALVQKLSLPAGKFVQYRAEGGLAPITYDGSSSSLLISVME